MQKEDLISFSRTRDFKNEFIEALSIADKVYLTEIDSNRETQQEYPNITSNIIVNEIENAEIISEETIDKLSNEIDSVVCFMSCAHIDNLIKSFKTLLVNISNTKE